MRRATVEGLYALLLVHAEGDAEKRLIVIIFHIKEATFGVELFGHIAREIHHGAVLDAGQGHLLDFFDGEVDIEPVVPIIDMAVKVNFIHLPVVAAGVVHQHDVVGIEVFTDPLFVKTLWGVCLHLGERLSAGILGSPSELLHRFAHREDKHAVDGAEHLGLQVLKLLLAALGIAQLESKFAKFLLDDGSDTRGVVGIESLGHHFGRHNTILGYEVGHSGIGTAIAQGMLHEPLHHLVGERTFASVDDALQEEVGLLQLVPKERVPLGKLARRPPMTGHSLGTQHIESREEPATAGRLLVGDTTRLHAVAEMSVKPATEILLAEGKGAHIIGRNGIHQRTVGRRTLINRSYPVKHLRSYAPLLGRCAERSGQKDCQSNVLFHRKLFYDSCFTCYKG